MKSNLVLKYGCLCLLFLPGILRAQKPLIDTSVYDKWPVTSSPEITNDGSYASFMAYYSKEDRSVFNVKSTHMPWSMEVTNAKQAQFSHNSRYVVYMEHSAGVVCRKLGGEVLLEVKGASRPLVFAIGKQDWLAYLTADSMLTCRNLDNGVVHSYEGVVQYMASADQSHFVILGAAAAQPFVKVFSVKDFKAKLVSSDKKAERTAISRDNSRIAFISASAAGKSIWAYQMSTSNLVELFSEETIKQAGQKMVNGPNFRFSASGQVVFFDTETVSNWVPDPSAVAVDVWNYLDAELYEKQLLSRNAPEYGLYAVNVDDKKLVRLLEKNETLVPGIFGFFDDRYAIVQKVKGSLTEAYWNPLAVQSIYLVNTETGKRITIRENGKDPITAFSISPKSKYIVYFDQSLAQHFCIETHTGIVTCITDGVKASWHQDYSNDSRTARRQPAGYMGWLDDESGMLINGTFDIWMIDPARLQPARCITNLIGSSNSIIFGRLFSDEKVFKRNQRVFLRAFDTKTKQAGTYEVALDSKKQPGIRKVMMADFKYGNLPSVYAAFTNQDAKRAKNANAYIVKRESSTSYPNYYTTKDFTDFRPLSEFQPHKQFNWLTSELHRFKLPDGTATDGILLKPENFDSSKRYPVIIYFYELLSANLNKFFYPTCGAVIDPAHFVSNGYLVFMPDIVYQNYHAGKGALQTVEAAYYYLREKPWVNADKAGFNAHSFGGFEANYIITHSKLFAAAATGAGISNMVAEFGRTSGGSRHTFIEAGYYRFKGTPWEVPADYVDGSPVFSIDKVVSPVLIFHNKNDGAVNFANGIEFFMGLRRAGKKVWMLQYDGERHANLLRKNRLDLETRYMQYFDHFLKEKPAPKWMTRGIPAKMKGIDDGLALDYEIKTPGEGLNIQQQ